MTPKMTPEDDPATALIFTLSGAGKTLKVVARPVTLGTLRNGQVEVLTGLTPGESYVAKSDRPLQSDQVVQRSLTSEF
ncbi:MAG: hypothetical protein HC857_16665 [Synechococcales cyanobacterium RU_4_20]|nr:hypothetical protein [Synechococcales cyanobacterium RU_4_20]